MAYIGQSIKNGTFSVLDTSGNTYNGSNTTFSLGTQVGSAAQLLVSHDGVIQKPGTDYTLASGGASITFTTAPASGASIFIVEISGAVGGTITPSDDSVTADKIVDDAVESEHLNDNIISGQTALATTPATTDEFLVSDAGTIKRVDFSLMGNTPCFYRQKIDSQQTFATGTATKITFNNEVLDSDSKMTNTTFTPTVVGYYNIFASWGINTSSDVTQMKCMIYKNGSVYATNHEYSTELSSVMVNTIVYLDADDYVEVYGEHNRGSSSAAQHDNATTFFGGFKLIGV